MLDYLLTCLKNIFLLLLSGVFTGILVAMFTQSLSQALRRGCGAVLGEKFYIYLTAPGIMLHEVGHAVFCILFGHKIKEIKLFSPEDDGTLGYVSHSYMIDNLYHRIGNFFIGTGPVWCGLLTIYLLSLLLLPSGMMEQGESTLATFSNFTGGLFSAAFWSRWQSLLWFYLVFSIAAHITLSAPDLKGAGDGLCFLLAAVCGAVLLFGWCGSWEEALIAWQWKCWSVALPIVLIFILLTGGMAMFLNMFKRRRSR